MPIYEYELDIDDDSRQQRFEIFQNMSDEPLTKHPETGQKIRRVISVPSVPRTYHPQSTSKMLSDKNLDRMGFTKYVKTDRGKYEKTAGAGPDKINRGDAE